MPDDFGQLMIDIEDNENCGYFPIQLFETQSKPKTSSSIIVPEVPGRDGEYEVVGWCDENGGSPCEATAVIVGDSGSGQALMIYGGEFGVRLRPSGATSQWSLEAADQFGEPYLLLPTTTQLRIS